MKEKKRGSCEDIEQLNPIFQKILGRNANKTEIRLFPYLICCLQDQEIERERLNNEEINLIKEYVEKKLMFKQGRTIGCTREFWSFITQVTYDRYVLEMGKSTKK